VELCEVIGCQLFWNFDLFRKLQIHLAYFCYFVFGNIELSFNLNWFCFISDLFGVIPWAEITIVNWFIEVYLNCNWWTIWIPNRVIITWIVACSDTLCFIGLCFIFLFFHCDIIVLNGYYLSSSLEYFTSCFVLCFCFKDHVFGVTTIWLLVTCGCLYFHLKAGIIKLNMVFTRGVPFLVLDRISHFNIIWVATVELVCSILAQ